jgi:hypothetical protein
MTIDGRCPLTVPGPPRLLSYWIERQLRLEYADEVKNRPPGLRLGEMNRTMPASTPDSRRETVYPPQMNMSYASLDFHAHATYHGVQPAEHVPPLNAGYNHIPVSRKIHITSV